MKEKKFKKIMKKKVERFYISYTNEQLQQIIDWFESGENDWERTERLFGIEMNYCLLKYKENTLSKKGYDKLENEFNITYAILCEINQKNCNPNDSSNV